MSNKVNGNKELQLAITAVFNECQRAFEFFPPFNSSHEGYAVLLEEVRELEQEVFMNGDVRDYQALYTEAVQVAAMACRLITDICFKKGALPATNKTPCLGNMV